MTRGESRTGSRTGPRARQRSGAAGFTVMELVIVMGMLGFFLVFLLQIMGDSVRIWQGGEERAATESRAAVVLETLSSDFPRLVGVSDRQYAPAREERFSAARGGQGGPSLTGRLYATWQGFRAGKPASLEDSRDKPLTLDWLPELRLVTMPAGRETELLQRRAVQAAIVAQEGQLPPAELAKRVRERLAQMPTRQPAEVAIRLLPSDDEEGCYLAVHRDMRLLDGQAPRWVDGAPLPAPGQPLVANLLYAEFLFRSQLTASFTERPTGKQRPERCWDSARAGTFAGDHPVLAFGLDLDQSSLFDPLDDVMPAAVQIKVVVDEGPGQATTALLGAAIDETSKDLELEYADRLPTAESQPFLKIGSEWIRYSGVLGGRLQGVQRGQRFTRPTPHRAGARVHAGREAVLVVPIAVAREYWNG